MHELTHIHYYKIDVIISIDYNYMLTVRAAIVFDDCFFSRRLFKHALIQAEALIVFKTCCCLIKTIILLTILFIHPKTCQLLVWNLRVICYGICPTFIIVFMHKTFRNQPRGCISSFIFLEGAKSNRGAYFFRIIFTPGPCSRMRLFEQKPLFAWVRYSMFVERKWRMEIWYELFGTS